MLSESEMLERLALQGAEATRVGRSPSGLGSLQPGPGRLMTFLPLLQDCEVLAPPRHAARPARFQDTVFYCLAQASVLRVRPLDLAMCLAGSCHRAKINSHAPQTHDPKMLGWVETLSNLFFN